ncbi:MAG: site-specific integrase, partial [Rhodomicrobium sp.]|nr:site-specific integrase [Rhodomicrobium sp.]
MPRAPGHRAQPEDEAPVEAFLHMMRAERGTSHNTISAYRSDLRELSAFLAAHGKNFLTCTRQHFEAFFASRAAGGLNPNSAARKLSCLKRFTRFLTAEGKRSDDPALLIDGAKAKRRLPVTLSVAEVDMLLAAAHEAAAKAHGPAQRRALRLACFLELLYGTGLRVSELAGLPRNALQGDRLMLTVKGKGGRERIVPLNPKARDVLDRYLEATRPAQASFLGEPKLLFPSHGESGHFTRQKFARDLKELGASI